ITSGIDVRALNQPAIDAWQMACLGDESTGILVRALSKPLSLSRELDEQQIAYSRDASLTSKTQEQLRYALGNGSLVTIETMRAPREESYRIIDIRDGQLGVTYKQLFDAYLAGAKQVRIVDPYVRMPHQVANIEKLLQLVEKPDGCQVHLITMFEKND